MVLKTARDRRYPIDYADDLALLANTPVQAKSLLHSLEQESEALVGWLVGLLGFMVYQHL